MTFGDSDVSATLEIAALARGRGARNSGKRGGVALDVWIVPFVESSWSKGREVR